MLANSCSCISNVVFIGRRVSVGCFGEPAQRRSECRRARRGPDVHFKRHQLKKSTPARTSSVYRHTQTQTRRGTYLIRVVKAVIHEPRDQRRLSHCKKREEEKLNERRELVSSVIPTVNKLDWRLCSLPSRPPLPRELITGFEG